MYFSLLFQSYWLSFSQRKVASFFSYFSQDILKVCFSKIFQDFSISSRIFRNLSFREGRWPSLFASSKIFQGLPLSRCSKIFQNLPEFSERLLLPKSPESFQPFYFHDFPKLLLGVFLTFQEYSEILHEFFIGFPIHFTQGIDEEGSFDFRFWFTPLLHLHVFLVRLVDIGYIRFCG